MKPSVGRIVHYHSYGTPGGEFKPEPRAAIITKVHSDYCVDLCAINPTGLFFNTEVLYTTDPTPGHWNWPPRVD